MSRAFLDRKWMAVLVVVAVAVSVVAMWLRASDRSAESQLEIVQQSTADLYRLSALEWQAIANVDVSTDLREEVGSTIGSIRAADSRLAQEGVIDQLTREAIESLLVAVEQEINLLGAGDVEAAIEIDEKIVDPLFEDIMGSLSATVDASRDHARRTDLVTTLALILAIGTGVAVTGYFVRQVGRAKHEADLLAAKDKFIAAVSHELRTPLTAVLGYATILSNDADDLAESERIEFASTIAREAFDVTGIVDDLLIAARSEMGNVHVRRVSTDLKANAAQVLEVLPEELQTKVRLGDQPDGMRAWGDPVRLRQILRNLISNAVRYGGDNIRVDFELGVNQAILLVRDDGPGIPGSAIDRIFLPFQVAHDVGTVPESVGLGLTVSHQLAELMGGTIAYRREKASSVFEVGLPVVTDLDETAARLAVKPTATAAPGRSRLALTLRRRTPSP